VVVKPNNKKFEGVARELIALRIANDLQDGTYVNLGIGIPTLVSNWIEGRDIVLQAEIGMLNTGPLAAEGEIDQDCINASCQAVKELPGSLAMIRGGYMDVAVLGALQVSEKGDLAGWNNPERGFPEHIGNIGGSMDLAVGARKVIVAMEHVTTKGDYKVVKKCTYPVTAVGVVKMIVTDLAVMEITDKGLVLKEVAPGLTAENVQSVTEPKLIISPDLKEMAL
jgi:3-oxoacid CoA-transferase B subunit